MTHQSPKVAEFFAGIGLARLGLEQAGFNVIWSNDIEPSKKEMYEANFEATPEHEFRLADVAEITPQEIPGEVELAWASFPCTDLSLAGGRAGLAGASSGTFWHFTRIIREMGETRPPVVVLENVNGLATSHGGRDLAAAVQELNDLGYSVDVVTLDARRFVPQSRPRLFMVGSLSAPESQNRSVDELRPAWLQGIFDDESLRTHQAALPKPPAPMTGGFGEIVEQFDSGDARWWDDQRRERFLESLSPLQASRLNTLKGDPRVMYRTAYRRTRKGVATWEIRADDISGCLRTARGGSSKQAVVMVGDGKAQVRWMTAREYARLMGAGDYALEGLRVNQALFGFGDGVCVPVVAWLAEHYLQPLMAETRALGSARDLVVSNA
ncbi:DNA cytosine methyltransferase [Cryobacterium levicorallinum]|uniref:DNA (cytosine-5-)-methyltransferase n=1 Tax=Cryobacterium levicorallinum TaxID=995038 RepID=A0ABY1EBR3_9MICO|nr:DNA (cytosine-5-)-methyltransferase [Cryobacterium levicorallinum]GEP25870.1 DNA (cytosine-5-)-methyltransferase [Cryobacterium levicorallinum]SFH38345.1 DNA (cytosine-5)-methyltransferase 1 [Cryobacterium levicorallinum]